MNKIELPQLLRPIKTPDLVRFGKKSDGGYLINANSISKNTVVLSFGINHDWSFEEDLHDKHKCEIFMFDFSVSKMKFRNLYIWSIGDIFSLKYIYTLIRNFTSLRRLVKRTSDSIAYYKKTYRNFSAFLKLPNIHFFEYGVSNYSNKKFKTFDQVLALIKFNKDTNDLFLKIDIEGDEYRILDDVVKESEHISQIILEVHNLDIMYDLFVEKIAAIKEHFFITHIHANNHKGLVPNKNFPRILELTFINKKLLPATVEHSYENFPLEHLDYPNTLDFPDYVIEFSK